MVTIYDIADHTGYSIATVSKALNNKKVSEKARRKILDAVEELHYTPNSSARTLATNKSWMIGVVFGENLGSGIAHPFFGQVIEGFKKHAELYNYDLLFVSRHMGLQQETYKHLSHRGVDGVVIVQSHGEDEIKKLDHMIPTVYIDRPTNESGTVYSDNQSGSRLAVNHLVENGHTKIAHIMGNQTTFPGIERATGFKKAMHEHGLPVREEYLVDGGFYSQAGGREAMIRLLSLKDKPTAVYVGGDEMAIAAMKVTKESGLKVPEDISFIGFDDIKIAQHVEPALTTIRQDKELIGQQAAIILLDKIAAKDTTRIVNKKMIPVTLIKRESVKRLA
ncbi:LacI family DNA-binding transcriptional regulator [Alkalibacterium sp. 20]|uniref:LacI family DNA-binding transcriptional regulator n=1 Tax=Alkalibacterium sp. 20 TaxID=1798803 RepID=UPI0009004739|nr:LacI family DNA-binding transcriptional regulator [Alkalibacterium sp. 20]OJF94728.1 LacI family transcriptional regulator [Alkalibacterium sp. 20]